MPYIASLFDLRYFSGPVAQNQWQQTAGAK
jgi:hypothetical protein